MADQTAFTSSKIAEEAKKAFGDKVQPIDVKMKFRREVGAFLRKVESAHKRAENSQLTFK